MTRVSVLKGIAQWVLERALEIITGAFIIGTIYTVLPFAPYILASPDFANAGPDMGNIYAHVDSRSFWQSLIINIKLIFMLSIVFYVYSVFFVTSMIHNYVTRKSTIQRRAITLAGLFTVHFAIFPTALILLQGNLNLLVFSFECFAGGVITILIVNTVGTRQIRRLLKVSL